MPRAASVRIALIAGLILSAPPCSAATYIVPPDDVSIRKAAVIVRGRVADLAGVEIPGGGIRTEITFLVEQVLKGAVPSPSIIVAQPGGRLGDAVESYPGIGSFDPGEEALLMLEPLSDGTFRLSDFALGKFHVGRTAKGFEFLRRDGLREAHILQERTLPDGEEFADPDRDAAAFERYIRALDHGLRPKRDYALPAGLEDTTVTGAGRYAEFELLGNPPGRWIEFATGGTITFEDNATGDTGAGCPTGCHAEVAAGVQAWNGALGALISYAYGGVDATIGSKCLTQSPSLVNEIQFGDPCDEMTSLSGCGGTLALGGFSSSNQSAGTTCPAKGSPAFVRITKGGIVVNSGVGGCLNPCNYQDMIAHEIGHTLGAGHSSDGSALMAAFLVNNRCGVLQSDDVAFAQCAYSGTIPTCTASTATSAFATLKAGILRAGVRGTKFRMRSIVQIDAGSGFVSAPRTIFRTRRLIVGRDVASLWPAGQPVDIRVLNPEGCVTNEITVTR